MCETIPADVEADLKRDFVRGIEDFRQGETMPIGCLILWKDKGHMRFTVYCYSSKYYFENVNEAEAKERIATAKEEIATLYCLFPELKTETHGYKPAYYFCYDTGKAAIAIAEEIDGQFKYTRSKA